jgi:hypothetical protein
MKKFFILFLGLLLVFIFQTEAFAQNKTVVLGEKALLHHETPDDPYLPPPALKMASPGYHYKSSEFFTVQVNVDSEGNNIIGDAANEPSIAIDPTNPNNMVIGWRQFDNVNSNFRQAGYGYTTDGGLSWTFPGKINPGVFRSDPVLDFDTAGNFYYNSLNSDNSVYTCKVFKSINGGADWDAGVNAKGGDKQWMAIDRSGGVGTGNIYSSWTSYYSSCSPGFFTRSVNDGASFQSCTTIPDEPYWGTMTVGPDGELYVAGTSSGYNGIIVAKSTTAQDPSGAVTWDLSTPVDLDGNISGWTPINPVGILGQANIEVDRSNGPGRGNVYVMASVERISNNDPADVMFAKSTDGGETWSAPVRINNDNNTTKYQWFGTMSVAPNGRIDIIWVDNRNAPTGSYNSALYYCYSDDQGETWSINKKLSNSFNPHLGFPQQEKIGDYYDMESDDAGAHLAWANTFNGEQDVYYTHIIPQIVGVEENSENPEMFSITSYPNPLRDKGTIQYQVPGDQRVKVVLCNMVGEEILTLVDKEQQPGTYTVNFSGESLPAGYYLCRLMAGSQIRTAKMVKVM